MKSLLRRVRRAVAYPFVAPVYYALFRMVPEFWAYVTEREL